MSLVYEFSKFEYKYKSYNLWVLVTQHQVVTIENSNKAVNFYIY